MTPLEKAKELIQFYSFGDNIVYNWTTGKKELIGAKNIYYKECALIAVDEIVNTIEYSSQADEMSKKSYWKIVKQEIEKL